MFYNFRTRSSNNRKIVQKKVPIFFSSLKSMICGCSVQCVVYLLGPRKVSTKRAFVDYFFFATNRPWYIVMQQSAKYLPYNQKKPEIRKQLVETIFSTSHIHRYWPLICVFDCCHEKIHKLHVTVILSTPPGGQLQQLSSHRIISKCSTESNEQTRRERRNIAMTGKRRNGQGRILTSPLFECFANYFYFEVDGNFFSPCGIETR